MKKGPSKVDCILVHIWYEYSAQLGRRTITFSSLKTRHKFYPLFPLRTMRYVQGTEIAETHAIMINERCKMKLQQPCTNCR